MGFANGQLKKWPSSHEIMLAMVLVSTVYLANMKRDQKRREKQTVSDPSGSMTLQIYKMTPPRRDL